jgi:iron only hydrogenase large subunit-like protein
MCHPEILSNISTTKSPQQLFGALSKTYYAEKMKIDPKQIFTVMLMPCVAKQTEAVRDGINSNPDFPDVDMTMTVRQTIRLFRDYNLDFAGLPETKYDDPLGLSSGSGLIFGTTGGVMESALRTISETVLNKRLENLNFMDVRGERGIKIACVPSIKDALGNPIRVAVVSSISNAEKLISGEVKPAECQRPCAECGKCGIQNFHFIEVMACLGGCVNGGGMPVHDAAIQNNFSNAMVRAKTLYSADEQSELRRSHENPLVKEIYKVYLGLPNGETAHRLLHFSYNAKGIPGKPSVRKEK